MARELTGHDGYAVRHPNGYIFPSTVQLLPQSSWNEAKKLLEYERVGYLKSLGYRLVEVKIFEASTNHAVKVRIEEVEE